MIKRCDQKLKDQAKIHRLAYSQKVRDKNKAIVALGSAFSLFSNKTQAWQDLLSLTQDNDINVRSSATATLGQVFHFMPDKTSACKDLFDLTKYRDGTVRWKATCALQSIFPILPDKILAWKVLFSLVQDKDSGVRWHAIEALESVFAFAYDKDMAWQDLLSLVQSRDSDVRWRATGALKSVLDLIPDKSKVWLDLLGLIQNQNSDVRWRAVEALGFVFFLVPDKTKACQDLLKLSENEDSDIICGVTEILGSVFNLMPDKKQVWQILIRFSQHDDSQVRMYAYHSLGRASVYRATETSLMDELRVELEAAVKFFEISSQEQSFFNPSSFCHPFYRSYLALTFQDASEAEVQKYLAEAKEAVGSSKDKKELFGAVENLAKALEESQKLKEKSREQIQSDLKSYQWYCDQAAEHMAAAEEKAPGAVSLLRKCNPIIEERIETAIAGIQKTAREICQVTRGSGTRYEAPGAQINREAKSLSSENPLNTFKSSLRIASILKEFCGLLPKDKWGHACEIVDEIEAEKELSGKLSKIELALTYLQPNINMAAHESATTNKLEEMHNDIKSIDQKLNTIIFDLSKIKIGSGDISANLCSVRTALNKIAEMEKGSAIDERSVSKHPANPSESQIALGNLIEAKVSELEEILKTRATKEDIHAILNKLESLKPSAGFEWIGRIADVIAVFDASIKVFQSLK